MSFRSLSVRVYGNLPSVTTVFQRTSSLPWNVIVDEDGISEEVETWPKREDWVYEEKKRKKLKLYTQ